MVKTMKKLLLTIITAILLIPILVLASQSINLGVNAERDFGTMSAGESKTVDYLVKGFLLQDEGYYSICVTHETTGEMKDWLRVKADQSPNKVIKDGHTCQFKGKMLKHWVGPDNDVNIWTLPKNVRVTLKIPRNTPAGQYNATVTNVGCLQEFKQVKLCMSIPTFVTVKVE